MASVGRPESALQALLPRRSKKAPSRSPLEPPLPLRMPPGVCGCLRGPEPSSRSAVLLRPDTAQGKGGPRRPGSLGVRRAGVFCSSR